MSRGAVAGMAGLLVVLVAYPIVALTMFRTEDPPGLRSGFAAPPPGGELPADLPGDLEIVARPTPTASSAAAGDEPEPPGPTTSAEPGAAAGDEGPLVIGLLVTDTDELLYDHLLEVARDTIADVNAAGGVAGNDVELVELRHDSSTDAGDAYARAAGLGVDVVVGPLSPGGFDAADTVSPEIPLVSPADYFGDDPVPGQLVTRAPWRLLGAAVDDLLLGGPPVGSAVFVVRDDLGTTTEAMDLAVAELAAAGVTAEVVPVADPEVPGDAAAQAVAAGADAVVVIGVDGDVDVLLTALVDAGLDTSATQVLVVGDLLAPVSAAGPAAGGVRGVSFDFGAGRQLAEPYGEVFLAPEVVHLRDTLLLVAVAAQAAASTGEPVDGPVLVAAVMEASRDGEPCTDAPSCLAAAAAGADVDVDGLAGPIELDDTGRAGVLVASVVTYDAAGQVRSAPEPMEVSPS